MTNLFNCCWGGSLSAKRPRLLGGPSHDRDRQLQRALILEDLERIQSLIAAGANVNKPDKNGVTPLQNAVLAEHMAIAEVLLDANAEVNSHMTKGFYRGRTALHLAAARGHFKLVKRLLKAGALVTIQDDKGDTRRNKHPVEGFIHGEIVIVKDKGGTDNSELRKVDKNGPVDKLNALV